MPDVGGVGNRGAVPPPGGAADEAVGKVAGVNAQPANLDSTVGPPGPLGQPTGVPTPVAPGQTQILPDVLAGRDPSQLSAAELLREAGGVSVTEKLLGLNRQPSVVGAFAAPPGNSEALRHMTPAMRRTVMRSLLQKQRQRMRRLASLVQHETDDREENERGDHDGGLPAGYSGEEVGHEPAQRERARAELGRTVRMLDLLEELLVMQDYTISQMGTFSKG